MTVFEFVFSLYSLLFGLALAQVFGGFGNVLQERHKLKVGWLTPLLGLFVILDLTSFWEIGWQMRGITRPYFLFLIGCVLVAGIYYLAARLVFPRNFEEWPDFDVYYFKHKQWVLGGILLCNVVATVALLSVAAPFMRSPIGFANFVSYFVLISALIAVRSKRPSIVLMLLMVSRYAVFPVLILLSVGTHGRVF